MAKIGLFPGSFDPITKGHLALINQSLKLVDRLIIAVANNTSKSNLLTVAERLSLIEQVVADYPAVSVIAFDGLVVDCAKQHDSGFIIRGIRNVSDVSGELSMAEMNKKMASEIETVLLVNSDSDSNWISSSLVREIAKLGGDIDQFVDPIVAQKLAIRQQGDD